jgi:CBS domain-containing protein
LRPEVPLLSRLVWLNLTIAAFNLLPAFPMDGGRVLRALLTWRMDRLHATRIAAGIGRTLAVALGLVGLVWNPLLALIALFVWFAASAEAQTAELDAATHGLRVGDAMVRHFEVLAPADTLAAASEHVLAGFQTDFPVVEGGRVTGVLTHADLILGLAEHGPAGLVDTVMQRDFCTATATESLPDALTRMGTKTCRAVPVLSGENLVGVLTLSGLGELVAIRSATELGISHGAR